MEQSTKHARSTNSVVNGRSADHPVDPVFLERWSPRAFKPGPIAQSVLMSLFEAARWAPSSHNGQPWRFVYAHRDTPSWEPLLGLLNEANRSWARHGSVLAFVVSKTMARRPDAHEDTPAYNHAFDTGAAWMSLALQAVRVGLHTHCMAGLDRQRAVMELSIPEGYRVEAAIVIGRLGHTDDLPQPFRDRETPSDRRPVESFAFEGSFGLPA